MHRDVCASSSSFSHYTSLRVELSSARVPSRTHSADQPLVHPRLGALADSSYSISTQIHGSKRWYLFPPSCTPSLRPLIVAAERQDSSVNCDTWSDNVKANFAAAGMLEVEQAAGETIFMCVPPSLSLHLFDIFVRTRLTSSTTSQTLGLVPLGPQPLAPDLLAQPQLAQQPHPPDRLLGACARVGEVPRGDRRRAGRARRASAARRAGGGRLAPRVGAGGKRARRAQRGLEVRTVLSLLTRLLSSKSSSSRASS